MDTHGELILAVDTSTPCSSVALTSGTRSHGKVIASLALSSNVTHSRRLLTAIEYLLRETGFSQEQITGFAVGMGPGSFTGLRIGMATMKGLAAAAGAPLYGVSTLDVVAAGCYGASSVCAVVDARKREVYTAFYRQDAGRNLHRVSDIAATSPQALIEQIADGPVLMVGDGLAVYGDFLREQLADNVEFAPAHLWSPSGAALGLIAGELRLRQEELELATAVPMYVRKSDAELNLIKKKTP